MTDTSRNIAAIMGPTLMVTTGLETLNFHIWAEIHPTTVFNNGALWFVGGLAVVRFHNLWVRDWRLLVTILGWLSLCSGLFRMAFPDSPQPTASIATFAVIGSLFLAGAMISWKAYLAKPQT